MQFGDIEDDRKLPAAENLPHCQDRKPLEVLTLDLDRFLEENMDMFQVIDHKIFTLSSFALQSKFVNVIEVTIFILKTNDAVDISLLHHEKSRKLLEQG